MESRSPAITLLIVIGATVIFLLLGLVPFAGLITYPIRLFSTFVHEASHALAAIISFGDVHGLVVRSDSSGTTWTSGGSRFLISTAGYLGTTFYGAVMLLSTRREAWARWAMGISGVLVLLLTSLYAGRAATWPVFVGAALTLGCLAGGLAGTGRSARRFLFCGAAVFLASGTIFYLWATDGLLTWVLGLGWAVTLLLFSRYTAGDTSKFLAAFLGVSVALNSLYDIFVLAGLSVTLPVAHTDANSMSETFGGPAIMWAVLWGIIAVATVTATGLFLVWDAWRGRKSTSGMSGTD